MIDYADEVFAQYAEPYSTTWSFSESGYKTLCLFYKHDSWSTKRVLASETFYISDFNETYSEVFPNDPVNSTDDIPDVIPDYDYPDEFEHFNGSEAVENTTYNSSFLGGAYASVDGLRGSVYGSVSVPVGYVVSPVNSLNSSVWSAVGYVDDSFNDAMGSSSFIVELYVPLINVLPDKVVNLVTYYLSWMLVIMIMRRR